MKNSNLDVRFSWNDKSGRGEKAIVLLEYIENDREITNYDGVVLRDWAESAELGEVWENATDRYECIIKESKEDGHLQEKLLETMLALPVEKVRETIMKWRAKTLPSVSGIDVSFYSPKA